MSTQAAVLETANIQQQCKVLRLPAIAAQCVFRPVTNNRTGDLDRPLDPASVYRNIVLKYGLETGISAEVNGLCLYFTGTIGGAYEVPGNIIQGPPECGSVEKIPGSSFWLGFGEPSCVSNLSRGVHNDYLIPTTIHSRSVSCSTLV
jgi:hypothetical protein